MGTVELALMFIVGMIKRTVVKTELPNDNCKVARALLKIGSCNGKGVMMMMKQRNGTFDNSKQKGGRHRRFILSRNGKLPKYEQLW